MTNASSKVGEAHVDLNLNMKPLEAGLEEAKVVTQETVTEIENKVVTGNTNIANSFQQSIGKITAFAGSVTAAVGVFGLFLRAGEAINRMLESNADKASRFADSIGRGNPSAVVEKTSAEIDKLTGKLAAIDEFGGFSRLLNLDEAFKGLLKGQGLVESLQDQIAAFDKERANAQKELDNEVIINRRNLDQQAIKESAERQRKIAIDLAEGEARLILEKGEALRKIEEQIQAAQSQGIKDALEQEKQAINEAFNIRIGRIREEEAEKDRQDAERVRKEIEAEAEKERRFLEAATRQARALERALSNAIDNASRQTDSLNGRLVTTVEAIESVVRNLNSNTIRRRN